LNLQGRSPRKYRQSNLQEFMTNFVPIKNEN
jgi:hypothetical protein